MTTPFNNNEKNFNELVFENRNKEYGAYAIRNSYNDAMTRSLLIMLGIVSTVVLSGLLFGGNGPTKKSYSRQHSFGTLPLLYWINLLISPKSLKLQSR